MNTSFYWRNSLLALGILLFSTCTHGKKTTENTLIKDSVEIVSDSVKNLPPIVVSATGKTLAELTLPIRTDSIGRRIDILGPKYSENDTVLLKQLIEKGVWVEKLEEYAHWDYEEIGKITLSNNLTGLIYQTVFNEEFAQRLAVFDRSGKVKSMLLLEYFDSKNDFPHRSLINKDHQIILNMLAQKPDNELVDAGKIFYQIQPDGAIREIRREKPIVYQFDISQPEDIGKVPLLDFPITTGDPYMKNIRVGMSFDMAQQWKMKGAGKLGPKKQTDQWIITGKLEVANKMLLIYNFQSKGKYGSTWLGVYDKQMQYLSSLCLSLPLTGEEEVLGFFIGEDLNIFINSQETIPENPQSYSIGYQILPNGKIKLTQPRKLVDPDEGD
jgi:hypothetical protein